MFWAACPGRSQRREECSELNCLSGSHWKKCILYLGNISSLKWFGSFWVGSNYPPLTSALGSAPLGGSSSLGLVHWEIPAFGLYIRTSRVLSQGMGFLPFSVLYRLLASDVEGPSGELGNSKFMMPVFPCPPVGLPAVGRLCHRTTACSKDGKQAGLLLTKFPLIQVWHGSMRSHNPPCNLGFIPLQTSAY